MAYVFTQDNDLSTLQTFTRYVIQVSMYVLANDSTSLADPNLLTYHDSMLIPMAQPTTPAKATSHHLSWRQEEDGVELAQDHLPERGREGKWGEG